MGSGTIENFDALCVLSLNIINEKIYVFLWFWFVILIAITGLKLIYRLVIWVVPQFRETILRRKVRHGSINRIHTICQNLSVGDWFVLNQLGKNMDTLIFKKFLKHFMTKLIAKKLNCLNSINFMTTRIFQQSRILLTTTKYEYKKYICSKF